MSVCVCLSLLVTTANHTKTTEPIEMPFGGLDSDKPKEQCAGWGPGAPQGKGQFWEDISWSIVKIGNLRREPCENGLVDRDAVWEVDLLGVSNALHGGADWRHLENMID